LDPHRLRSGDLVSMINTSTISPFLKFTLSLLAFREITEAFTISPTEAFLVFLGSLKTLTTEAEELSTI
jgi:hypothetical protein